eukprot:3518070-Karenia_brevis.AAC.1
MSFTLVNLLPTQSNVVLRDAWHAGQLEACGEALSQELGMPVTLSRQNDVVSCLCEDSEIEPALQRIFTVAGNHGSSVATGESKSTDGKDGSCVADAVRDDAGPAAVASKPLPTSAE